MTPEQKTTMLVESAARAEAWAVHHGLDPHDSYLRHVDGEGVALGAPRVPGDGKQQRSVLIPWVTYWGPIPGRDDLSPPPAAHEEPSMTPDLHPGRRLLAHTSMPSSANITFWDPGVEVVLIRRHTEPDPPDSEEWLCEYLDGTRKYLDAQYLIEPLVYEANLARHQHLVDTQTSRLTDLSDRLSALSGVYVLSTSIETVTVVFENLEHLEALVLLLEDSAAVS